MSVDDEELFSGAHVGDLFARRSASLREDIERYPEKDILGSPEEDVCRYFIDRYSHDPLRLMADKIEIANTREVDLEARIQRNRVQVPGGRTHVRGTEITVAVPFEGDAIFFQYHPTHHRMSHPRGKVVKQEVHLTYQFVDAAADSLKKDYTQDVRSIEEYVRNYQSDVAQYNKEVEPLVRKLVGERDLPPESWAI
jgi:hypothetical protein